MRTYIIGRSPHADIVLADTTVSPHHAELVVSDDGRFFITDCASPGGTLRRTSMQEQGPASDWQAVRQSFFDPDEPLRLGDCQCSLRQLLQLAEGDDSAEGPSASVTATPADHAALLHGSVQRDPHTGEIVRRRI